MKEFSDDDDVASLAMIIPTDFQDCIPCLDYSYRLSVVSNNLKNPITGHLLILCGVDGRCLIPLMSKKLEQEKIRLIQAPPSSEESAPLLKSLPSKLPISIFWQNHKHTL